MRIFWLVIIILVLLLLTACGTTNITVSGNSLSNPNISIKKTFIMPKPTTYDEERTVEDNYPVLPVIVENLDK